MTPNHLDEASEKLQEIRENKQVHDGNPMLILKCPVCKTSVDVGCYSVEQKMTIRCKNNPSCEFHGGLPIYLIDDDIYSERPTLLLSTVDKFARIVWEEKAGALFGVGESPPELIIQDELHLISGPLGSLVGDYEIAVEKLCESDGILPKIIASTATVKNAGNQIRNLYNRRMFQFPPSGMTIDDSFFAVRADMNLKPARIYIGLCENGGNLSDLLLRVYACLVFMRGLFKKNERSDEVIDQFSTIIGYFNALKDLGASASIIDDRLRSILHDLILNKFPDAGLSYKDIQHFRSDELTSRKTSKEIKETLKKLETSYPDKCYSHVLASNMLSVGIDIDRLGLITMYNQPKTNSEYIQATSRIGRSAPGVAIAMFNAMRSRDKSHYEQFNYYHKTFYQNVEPTSVTPFSKRAIEKAMQGVFIALVRHLVPNMNGNADAVNFRENLDGVSDIKKYILDRAPSAKSWIDEVENEWEYLAVNNPDTFVYSNREGNVCLLKSAENLEDDFFTVLNSLRDVESTSNIYIRKRDR